MCGIAGFVGNGCVDDLKRMNGAQEHRGPDAEGVWIEKKNNVYFGHRRLSILDISGGIQPMVSGDEDMVITFNGEIYNFGELRIKLVKKGYHFKTDHSDTEVLLMGYREWGTRLPEKLSGMWAFVIYDIRKGVLFCSRDRFGKKPFYYSFQNRTFVFSSELTSLVCHTSVTAEIFPLALRKYFAYGYIPAPLTIYKSIFKLEAGYSMTVDIKNLNYRTEKYWDFVLEPFERIPKNPEQEWGEEIRRLLEKAVKIRMIADVPLGIFLSGGIDSSIVTAMASRCGSKIKTFSIGFNEASFDESKYYNKISEMFGTEHRDRILNASDAYSISNVVAKMLDEPMADSSILPTYLLSEFTRKFVTVAVGGDGGDEMFAGYDPFKALKAAEFYSRLVPKPVHRGLMMLMSRLPVSHQNMSLDFKIKKTLGGLSFSEKYWLPAWMAPLMPSEIDELFGETCSMENVYSEVLDIWDNTRGSMVDKALIFYSKLYLQDDILAKTDRASMMNSLEVRSPFLDKDLVEFVRKIPWQYKFRNGESKYILKKAFSGILPDEIINRKKKGFGIPIGKWLMEGKLKVGKDKTGLLDQEYIQKNIEDHLRGRKDRRLYLWSQIVLNKFIA